KTVEGKIIALNAQNASADINLEIEQGNLYFTASDSVFVLDMSGQRAEEIAPLERYRMNTQTVYTLGNLHFAVRQFFQSGKAQLVYAPPQQGGAGRDALQTEITLGNQSKNLIVYGMKGMIAEPYTTTIDGTEVSVSFGSKK